MSKRISKCSVCDTLIKKDGESYLFGEKVCPRCFIRLKSTLTHEGEKKPTKKTFMDLLAERYGNKHSPHKS